MIGRRLEDRVPKLFFLGEPNGARLVTESSPLENRGGPDSEEVVVVWSSAGNDVLAIEGRAWHLNDGSTDPERVEAQAVEWHRERVRLRQRAESGERFVVFSEQMARVHSEREVFETLIEHAAAIAGGFRADIWSEGNAELLAPTLVQRREIEESGAFAALEPMLEAAGASSASVVGIGGGRALVVLERRSERRDEPRHWYLLRAMSAQAWAALARVVNGIGRGC